MKDKLFVGSLLGISTCAAALVPQTAQAREGEKPNILIIYTDDMGIGDLSVYNNGWVKTPNIDRLASQGLVMNGYYTAAPVSSPSRVGITTGMFPLEWGINTYLQWRDGNRNCEQFDYLDPAAPSMARVLKGAGYATAHIGKWHMGGGRDVYNAPQISEYGFDESISTWESPRADPRITGDSTWIWSPIDPVKRWDRTAFFVDNVLDFLARHKGQPCFVNLWPDDMHDPWVQDEGAQDHENTWQTPSNFGAVLAEYDRQIGRLMEGLRKQGLEKNTIVIFTSDNGPAPSFEQVRANQLRGVKCSLYEGGINMPFIVRWPERIKAGQVDKSSVICAVDLLPSLCAITGATMPSGFAFSGEDMSGALTGMPQVRQKDIMWEFGRSKFFAQPIPYQKSPHLAIRRGDMKLLVNSADERTELYDLAADPQETTNIADKHPELVKELKAKVLKWWDERKKI